MSKRILSLLIVAAMLILTACAAPAPSAPAAEGEAAEADATEAPAEEGAEAAAPAAEEGEQILIGGFDVGPGGDPQVVPYFNGAGNMWLAKLFTPLVMMTADYSELTPEGSLSTGWEANEDNTVWTFTLREGVTWHDGEPFTADDVIFTYELVNHPESGAINTGVIGDTAIVEGLDDYRAGEADNISGIQAVDDTTVQFTLTAPNPRFPDALRFTYVLPEHQLADLAPADMQQWDWWFESPVGTGPFQFSAYERDQFMELVPNENYWDGAPKLDKLVNRYFADETAAVLALEAGDIDFTYVSADVAQGFEGEEGYEIFSGPSYVANFLIFNARNEPWGDERIRQAFLYAIDRQAIVDEIYGGAAEVAPCADPYNTYWPEDANDYAYDPAMAQQLLEEAGFDGSVEFEVPTYYSSQLAKDVLQAFQAYLGEAGVNVVPRFMEPAAWRGIVEGDLNYDIAYRGMGAGPASFPEIYYVPDLYTGLEGGYYGINDAQLNELIAAMNATTEFEDYKAARTEVCRYMNEVALQPFMWVSTRYGVAQEGLQDFYYFPAPGGGPYLDNSHLWSVAE